MQYYDFTKHWQAFNKILQSDEIKNLIISRGELQLPLSRNCETSVLEDWLDEMREKNPEHKKALEELDEIYIPDSEEWDDALQDLYDNTKILEDTSQIVANVPVGACHSFAPILFAIAKKLCPKYKWILLKGNHHSTVFTLDGGGILFDLIMYFLHMTDPNTGYDPELIYKQTIGSSDLKSCDKTGLFNTRVEYLTNIADFREAKYCSRDALDIDAHNPDGSCKFTNRRGK